MRRLVMILVLAMSCSQGSNRGTGKDTIEIIPVDLGFEQAGEDISPTFCTVNADCPPERPRCDTSKGVCVQCLSNSDCGGGYCVDGTCKSYLCEPNSVSCVNNVVKVCDSTGYAYLHEFPCGDMVCVNGQCLVCVPGSKECSPLNEKKVCKQDGSGWDVTSCGEKKCVEGECSNCVPLAKKCDGNRVMRCTPDGDHYEFIEDCDTENTGRICYVGMCLDLCQYNEKFKTNQGCEYYAIDMDQSQEDDGQDSPYAVVISNTTQNYNAHVVVSKPDGSVVKELDAPPRQATIIYLPPFNIIGAIKAPFAYYVKSSLPVVAYQFNPLENVGVYSNDASLLLPTNALGKNYMVMSYPTLGTNSLGQMLASNFAVVGVENGTNVHIKVTARTIGSSQVPTLSPGQTYDTVLNRFEVLNIEAADQFGDLTGSTVEADKKVAVFAGHVCAMVPLSQCVGGRCSYDPTVTCTKSADCPWIYACDHMEEQLPPLSAWGRHYVVTKLWDRGKAPDLVRILASEDGTTVTLNPSIKTVPTLNRGQFFEFEISQHVEVVADKPVLVGQFMEGQDAPYAEHKGCYDDITDDFCEMSSSSFGCSCYDQSGVPGASCTKQSDCSPNDANIGDPSFIVSVPVEQFRQQYVFLVPTKYRSNYINVIAEASASVSLDGAPIQSYQFTTLPSGVYKVARLPISEGSHVLTSDRDCGVVVYGWDFYVSYGYPGGMRTETLKVE